MLIGYSSACTVSLFHLCLSLSFLWCRRHCSFCYNCAHLLYTLSGLSAPIIVFHCVCYFQWMLRQVLQFVSPPILSLFLLQEQMLNSTIPAKQEWNFASGMFSFWEPWYICANYKGNTAVQMNAMWHHHRHHLCLSWPIYMIKFPLFCVVLKFDRLRHLANEKWLLVHSTLTLFF